MINKKVVHVLQKFSTLNKSGQLRAISRFNSLLNDLLEEQKDERWADNNSKKTLE